MLYNPDMENKAIEKEIDSLIQKRGTLATYTFFLAGGVIGLFLTLDNFLKLFLFIGGIFLFIIFLKDLLNIEDRINSLIKELK
jgi:hypothetical protein